MLIKKAPDIKSSEVTDEKTYLNRRLFIRGAVLAGSVAATGFIYRKLNPPTAVVEERPKLRLNDASQGRGGQRTIKRA